MGLVALFVLFVECLMKVIGCLIVACAVAGFGMIIQLQALVCLPFLATMLAVGIWLVHMPPARPTSSAKQLPPPPPRVGPLPRSRYQRRDLSPEEIEDVEVHLR